MKKRNYFYLLILVFVSNTFPQNEKTDLRHSVFGPVRPSMWEFQLSLLKEKNENITSFNFYKKNQRNKTIFLKISNNGLNNRDEFRVKEITGGVILFPFNDDDRFQVDVGGTYDKIISSSLYDKSFFSRLTYRPMPELWLRIGSEYYDGYTSKSNSFQNKILNSNYFAGKYSYNKFSLIGLIGTGKVDNNLSTRYGFAGIIEIPFNLFFLGGYIKNEETKENIKTIAVGRWTPFYQDGLPAAIFIWKYKENYDFQLGGLFWGKQNLFVRPAAIGMSQGIYISSLALRENSKLRQGQLMSITDDYRNSDITLFYIYLKQGIEMIPGKINYVGVKVIQLYKIFSEVNFAFISKPVVGIFFNEETEPEFDIAAHKFIDKKKDYFSYQAGIAIQNNFIFNLIHSPKTSEWKIALSYIYF